MPLFIFAGSPSQGAGKSFIKSCSAVCLEGAIIVLACIIFSLFAASLFAVDPDGFLSIIVAITIFHIMNTINMGVTAKMKEYGAMRAIGMNDHQLVKMIIAEAVTYSINGVIWGCIIGLPMHWIVYVSLVTNFWGTAWSIPFKPLGLIIVVIIFTSFLAVRQPTNRLHKMSIVDTISVQ